MSLNLKLQETIKSAEEVIECHRILANTDSNIVGDLLRFSDKFVQWNHYPKGDVKDQVSGSQYYYHAHPNSKRGFSEHGHFHLFMKNSKDHKDDVLPLTHIIAISMDVHGIPQALFTVNHWVTGGIWENADIVESFLDKFIIDHTQPSWVVNRWVNSILKLYRSEIIELIKKRDSILDNYKEKFPQEDIHEFRELEIISFLPISIEKKLLELKAMENNND